MRLRKLLRDYFMKHLLFFFLLTSLGSAVPSGYKSYSWAEPHRVEYPTALTAAADGTVYVSCDKNGSLGKEKNFGRVVACRDTDGDHRADSFVDFIPKIDSPRGGHFVRDTLYLVHPPFVSAFRDTTGDGVADEQKILLENLGFGLNHPRGSDHTTNGLRMGIDGWLYIAVGDFGMEGTRGADGRTITYQGGCIARVRPDGSDLEIYSHNIRNSCDVAISPTLDLFTRDNTNDGKGWNIRLHHFTHGSDHGYPRLYKNFADECISPMLDLGGGSGTGVLYLAEPGLPEMLLTCDWTTGTIYHDALTQDGAGFKAKESVWMELPRAVDIDVDGESNLYVCDWRNGRFSYAGDGVKVGLIQKLVKEGLEVEKFPDLKSLDDDALVQQLFYDSSVRRLETQREILSRGEKMAAKLIEAKAKIQSDSQNAVWIFTLKQLLGEKAEKVLRLALEKRSSRALVLRALADRKEEISPSLFPLFLDYLKDGVQGVSKRTQLQAAIGLARMGHIDQVGQARQGREGASHQLLKLASETTDLRLRHACIQALIAISEDEILLQNLSNPAAQQALKRLHSKNIVERLIKQLDDASLQWAAITILARLYHQEGAWDKKSWWGTRPDDRGPYFNLATWKETPVIKTALETFYEKSSDDKKGELLEIFNRNRIEISKLNLGVQDPVILALHSTQPNQAQAEILRSASIDDDRPWSQRLKAFRALSRIQDGKANRAQVEILGHWLEHEKNQELVNRELQDYVNQSAHSIFRKEFHQIAKKANIQMSRVAWQVLLSMARSPLTKHNFKKFAMQRAQANPREVGFYLALADLKMTGFDAQIENAIQSDNDTLIAAAKNAKKVIAEAHAGKGKKISQLPVAEVTRIAMVEKGDVAKGEALYISQGCIACHAVDQKAVQKGPYLGSAGGKFTRDYLIESILDPNAVVAQGFQTELVTMNDGSVHMGFVTREQDGEIDLRNIAGIVTPIQAAEVKKREHQSGSMMPAGLAQALTAKEFTDLIEYLVSLR